MTYPSGQNLILADGLIRDALIKVTNYIDKTYLPLFGLDPIQSTTIMHYLSDWSKLVVDQNNRSRIHHWEFNPHQMTRENVGHEAGHRIDDLKLPRSFESFEDYNRGELVANLVGSFFTAFEDSELEELIETAKQQILSIDFGGRLDLREQDYEHEARHLGGRNAADYLIGKADGNKLALHEFLEQLLSLGTTGAVDFLRENGYNQPLFLEPTPGIHRAD